MAKSRYLYTAFLLEKEKYEEVKEMLPKLESASKTLMAYPQYRAYAESLEAAIYAYSVKTDMSMILSTGIKCSDAAERALKTDPNSPYAHTEYGHLKFYAPFLFGGSYSIALEHYKKAVEIFEKEGRDLSCNWYYVNALLFLAKSYDETDQKEQAIKVYDKILQLAPTYVRAARWRAKLLE